jgi:iron complex outermembrane receptor protein
VDLIDRIEVIRGPSAAIYGSNAFFAVINVVTVSGGSLQGAEVALSAASFGTHAGRASYGRALGRGLDVLVSASFSDAKGQRLYFPEYDQPSTNNGVFEAGDHESFHKLLATASKGNFSLQASSVSRDKGVPTGAFGTVFNDPRTATVDALSLASLSYNRSFSGGASVSSRLHGGRWAYKGLYAYAPDREASHDDGVGEWWGVDVDAARGLSRHFFTVGAEYRNNFQQDQRTYDPEPYLVYNDVHNHSERWGLFAQDEIKVVPPLTLHAGVRYDRYKAFGTTSPRVGLIFTPGSATTVKLLAGRAFRAPNEFELHFESIGYRANPALKPERIETLEVMGQRLIGGSVQISLSAFRNRLSDLISQRGDSSDNDFLVFRNVDAIESRGVELGLQVNRGRGPTGQVTYSLQRTEDRATRLELTNSPRHMANLQLLVPLARKMSAALDAQYVSGRKTLGRGAHGYAVANVSLLVLRLARRVDLSATLYNIFDTPYGVPGSGDHLQEVIPRTAGAFVLRRRSISRMALVSAALLVGAYVDGQTPRDESQIKAAFVYNFLKFVEWPAEVFHRPDEPLVVAIVGEGPTAEATEQFLATKQVGGRRILVRRVGWEEPLAGVHAVFVTEGDAKKLRYVLAAASARPILSIGEGESFASSGGLIGLVIEQRKVRFDIDMAVAEATGLKVSSKLLALTRVVHPAKDKMGDRR